MGQAVDGSDSYAAEAAPASDQPDNKSINPGTPAANQVVCSTAGMRVIV